MKVWALAQVQVKRGYWRRFKWFLQFQPRVIQAQMSSELQTVMNRHVRMILSRGVYSTVSIQLCRNFDCGRAFNITSYFRNICYELQCGKAKRPNAIEPRSYISYPIQLPLSLWVGFSEDTSCSV